MNIDPMYSDLPTDAEVNAIHDRVFVATSFGLPAWKTRHLVGIVLVLANKVRATGQSDEATKPVVIAIIDQLAVNVVLTPGERENLAAITQRLVTEAYNARRDT
jgi:hypothetical protein